MGAKYYAFLIKCYQVCHIADQRCYINQIHKKALTLADLIYQREGF